VNRLSLAPSRERVYAGGEVITGASNVSNAMAYGKDAARHIDEQLTGMHRWSSIFPEYKYERLVPGEASTDHRHPAHAVSPALRVQSDVEVMSGLLDDEVHEETCRCLRCDVKTAGVS
jgi:NADH-quinone oxidoreductase subunit F